MSDLNISTSKGYRGCTKDTAAVAATGSAVVEGVQNYKANKFAEAEANINRAQSLQARKQAYQEGPQPCRGSKHTGSTGTPNPVEKHKARQTSR